VATRKKPHQRLGGTAKRYSMERVAWVLRELKAKDSGAYKRAISTARATVEKMSKKDVDAT
jgi:hypothetical protein